MKILKNKDFLLLIFARLIINFADSLFYIVTIWYTSKTLCSPYYTSVAVFLFLLPDILLFFIGPIIDKLNAKKILLFSLIGQVVLLFLLAIFFNHLGIHILLIIMFLSSFMSNITYPIEDTIVPQIVNTDELVAANSMLSITYRIFDSLFNGVSGFLLVAFSTVTLIKINLVIFIIPIFIVVFIRFQYKKQEGSYNLSEYFVDLKEGAKFIKNSPLIYILTPLIFVNFFNASNAVILPFFSQQYSNSAEAFGLIMALKGIGGILGALLINYFKKFLPVGKLLSVLLSLNGIFWIAFIFTGGSSISYVFVILTYVFFGMYNIIYSALIQAITPINIIGRVTTAVDTLIGIAMPLGSLFGGWIVKFLPYNYCMMFSGISVIITGLFYYVFKQINSLSHIDTIERIE